jgi:hypothetical protein
MSKIVESRIEPIRADKVRFDKLMTVTVPVEAPPDVYCPKLSKFDATTLHVVAEQETINHARECARSLIERMNNFPHTKEAGDLLSMAFTVMHFTGAAK